MKITPSSCIATTQVTDSTLEKIKKTSLYLPADLMKRLKIYCIQEEKTMTAVLQEAIEAFVCRKEKLAEKRQEGTLF